MVLGGAGQPGWPAVLADGPVLLRPYRRRDAPAWSQVRLANEAWLTPWEPTVAGPWAELNSPSAYRLFYQDLRRSARDGTAMPFAILFEERYVGHLSLGNIARRAFGSGYAGYWVDSSVAGRGVMPTALALLVDHAFGPAGLHRVEVNIRPENGASLRVVEKLGFREEGMRLRLLHIDGDWRDHRSFALTAEEVHELFALGRPVS
jgi:[ribosomal protein S5]-alanine N-acetyltransferase